MKKLTLIVVGFLIAISGFALTGCGKTYDNLSLRYEIAENSDACVAMRLSNDAEPYEYVTLVGNTITINAYVDNAPKGFNYNSSFNSTNNYVAISDVEVVGNRVTKTIRADYPGKEYIKIKTAEGDGDESIIIPLMIIEKTNSIAFKDSYLNGNKGMGVVKGSEVILDKSLLDITPSSSNEIDYMSSIDDGVKSLVTNGLGLRDLGFYNMGSNEKIVDALTVTRDQTIAARMGEGDNELRASKNLDIVALDRLTLGEDGNVTLYKKEKNEDGEDVVITEAQAELVVNYNNNVYNRKTFIIDASSITQPLTLSYDNFGEGTNDYFVVTSRAVSGNKWEVNVNAVNPVGRNGYKELFTVRYANYDVSETDICKFEYLFNTIYYPGGVSLSGGSTLVLDSDSYKLTTYDMDYNYVSYFAPSMNNSQAVGEGYKTYTVFVYDKDNNYLGINDLYPTNNNGNIELRVQSGTSKVAITEFSLAEDQKLYVKAITNIEGYKIIVVPTAYVKTELTTETLITDYTKVHAATQAQEIVVDYQIAASRIDNFSVYNVVSVDDISGATGIYNNDFTDELRIDFSDYTDPDNRKAYFLCVNEGDHGKSTITVSSSSDDIVRVNKINDGVFKILPQKVGRATITVGATNLSDTKAFTINYFKQLKSAEVHITSDTGDIGKVDGDTYYVKVGGKLNFSYVINPIDCEYTVAIDTVDKDGHDANTLFATNNARTWMSIDNAAKIYDSNSLEEYTMTFTIKDSDVNNVNDSKHTYKIRMYEPIESFTLSNNKNGLYNPAGLSVDKRNDANIGISDISKYENIDLLETHVMGGYVEDILQIKYNNQYLVADNSGNYSYNGQTIFTVRRDKTEVAGLRYVLALVDNDVVRYPSQADVILTLSDQAGRQVSRALTIYLRDPITTDEVVLENVEDNSIYTTVAGTKTVHYTLYPNNVFDNRVLVMALSDNAVSNDILIVDGATTDHIVTVSDGSFDIDIREAGNYVVYVIPYDNIVTDIDSIDGYDSRFFKNSFRNALINVTYANGTEEHPFYISSETAFTSIQPTDNNWYVITKNLNFDNYTTKNTVANISGRLDITALGSDGNASVIQKYHTVTINSFASSQSSYGLFGTSTGKISDITVIYRNININNVSMFGGVATVNGAQGVISNVKVSLINVNILTSATSESSIGGIVAENNGRIDGYKVSGSITVNTNNNAKLGGVVGYNRSPNGIIRGTYSEEGTPVITFGNAGWDVALDINVYSVNNAGKIGSAIGGVVGRNESIVYGTNVKGAIRATAFNNVGGIAGVNTATIGTTIESNKYHTYTTMYVEGNDYVGGAVGNNTGNVVNTNVENYNNGEKATRVLVKAAGANCKSIANGTVDSTCHAVTYYKGNGSDLKKSGGDVPFTSATTDDDDGYVITVTVASTSDGSIKVTSTSMALFYNDRTDVAREDLIDLNTYDLKSLFDINITNGNHKNTKLNARSSDTTVATISQDGKLLIHKDGEVDITIYPEVSVGYAQTIHIFVVYGINTFNIYNSSNFESGNTLDGNNLVIYTNLDTNIYTDSAYIKTENGESVEYVTVNSYDLKFTVSGVGNFSIDGNSTSVSINEGRQLIHVLRGLVKTTDSVNVTVTPVIKLGVGGDQIELSGLRKSFNVIVKEGATTIAYVNNDSSLDMNQRSVHQLKVRLYTDDENDTLIFKQNSGNINESISRRDGDLSVVRVSISELNTDIDGRKYKEAIYNISYNGPKTVKNNYSYSFHFTAHSRLDIKSSTYNVVIRPQDLISVEYVAYYGYDPNLSEGNASVVDYIYIPTESSSGVDNMLLFDIFTYPDFAYYDYITITTNLDDTTNPDNNRIHYNVSPMHPYMGYNDGIFTIRKEAATFDNNENTVTYSFRNKYMLQLWIDERVTEGTRVDFTIRYFKDNGTEVTGLNNHFSLTAVKGPTIVIDFAENNKINIGGDNYLPIDTINALNINIYNTSSELTPDDFVITGDEGVSGDALNSLKPYKDSDGIWKINVDKQYAAEIIGKRFTITATIYSDGVVGATALKAEESMSFIVTLYNLLRMEANDAENGVLKGLTNNTLELRVHAIVYSGDESNDFDGKTLRSYISDLEKSYNEDKTIWQVKQGTDELGQDIYKGLFERNVNIQFNPDYDESNKVVKLLSVQECTQDMRLEGSWKFDNGVPTKDSSGGIEFSYDFTLKFNMRTDLKNAIPVHNAEEFMAMEDSLDVDYILVSDIVLSDYEIRDAGFASLNGNGKTVFITGFKNAEDETEFKLGLFNEISEDTMIINLNVCYTGGAEAVTSGDHQTYTTTSYGFTATVNGTSWTVADSEKYKFDETKTTKVKHKDSLTLFEELEFTSNRLSFHNNDIDLTEGSKVEVSCVVYKYGTDYRYVYTIRVHRKEGDVYNVSYYNYTSMRDNGSTGTEEYIITKYKSNGSPLSLNYPAATSLDFGGLAITNYGAVSNVAVSGTVNIRITESSSNISRSAGLIVNNATGATITNSWVEDFSISSYGDMAGFVLVNDGKISSSATNNILMNNESRIIALSEYANAGFVRTNNATGEIFSCYSQGSKSGSDTTIAYTGGGFIGNGRASGFAYNNQGSIKNCYSNMYVSTSSDSCGFVFNNTGKGIVDRCYSISKVKSSDSTASAFTGITSSGGTSVTYEGEITNCFYLDGNFKVFDNEPAVMLTLDQMSAVDSFNTYSIDLNVTHSVQESFGYVWKMQEGAPRLVSTLTRVYTNMVEVNAVKRYSRQIVFDKVNGLESETPDSDNYFTYKSGSDVLRVMFADNDGNPTSIITNKAYKAYLNGIEVSVSSEDDEFKINGDTIEVMEVESVKYYYAETGDAEGSITNPYLIYDVDSFNYYMEAYVKNYNVTGYNNNSNYYTYGYDKYFRIITDIDFEGRFITTPSKAFGGNIDANNMTLSNIDIIFNKDIYGEYYDSFGLFAVLRGATIKNLDLDIVTVQTTSHYYVGALAGKVEDYNVSGSKKGTMLNNIDVKTSGLVIGVSLVGGLVGYSTGDFVYSNISGQTHVNSTNTLEVDQFNRVYLYGEEDLLTDSKWMINGIEYEISVYLGNYTIRKTKDVSGKAIDPIKVEEGTIRDGYFVFKLTGVTFRYDETKVYVVHTSDVSYAGGLFGALEGTTKSGGYDIVHLQNAYISGETTVVGRTAGGMIGYISENTQVRNINLIVNPSNQFVQATKNAGGLVGENRGEINIADIYYIESQRTANENSNNSIAKLGSSANTQFFRSPVYAGEFVTTDYIGGIVGLNFGGKISNVRSELDVIDTKATSAGGLVGLMLGGEMNYAVTTGAVESGMIMGGAIGTITTYAVASDKDLNAIYMNDITQANIKTELVSVVAANNWLANYRSTSGANINEYRIHTPNSDSGCVTGALVGMITYDRVIANNQDINTYLDVSDSKVINTLYQSDANARATTNAETIPYFAMPILYFNTNASTLNKINTAGASGAPAGPEYYVEGVRGYSHMQMYAGVDIPSGTIITDKIVTYENNIGWKNISGDYFSVSGTSVDYLHVLYNLTKQHAYYKGMKFIDPNADLVYEPVDPTFYVKSITFSGASFTSATIAFMPKEATGCTVTNVGSDSIGMITYDGNEYYRYATEGNKSYYRNASLTNEIDYIVVTFRNGNEIASSSIKYKNIKEYYIYKSFTDVYWDKSDSDFYGAYTVASRMPKLNKYIGVQNWINYTEEVTPVGNTYTISSPEELAWVADQVNKLTYDSKDYYYSHTDEDGYSVYINSVSERIKVKYLSGSIIEAKDNSDSVISEPTTQITHTSFSGMTIKLNNDLDMSGRYWTPIGLDDACAFSGIFDGKGHTIKNINVDAKGNAGVDYTYAGLFGYTTNATIKNITVDDGSITGTYAGGIVAKATSTTIYNVINNNNVYGYQYAGGIIGYIAGANSKLNGESTNTLTNNGEVYLVGSDSTDKYLGGAAGYVGDDSTITGTIVNNGPIANTDTSANNTYIGGVFGRVYPSSTTIGIDNANIYNHGQVIVNVVNIINSDHTNPYYANIGGVAGYYMATASNTVNIKNYAAIEVVIKNNTDNVLVGGVFGQSLVSTDDIKVGNEGSIKISSTYDATAYIGGVVGVASAQVSKTYNVATIKAMNSAQNNYWLVGGVVGYVKGEISIDNNYNQGVVESHGYVIAGGILGSSDDSGAVTIQHNYNTGRMITDSYVGDKTSRAGGLIGLTLLSGKISNYEADHDTDSTVYYINRSDDDTEYNYYHTDSAKYIAYVKDGDPIYGINTINNNNSGTIETISESKSSADIKRSVITWSSTVWTNNGLSSWYPTISGNEPDLSWNSDIIEPTYANGVYEIRYPEQLAALSAWVEKGLDTTGLTFKLADSVNMSNRYFTPIGTESNPFKGTFDGGDYVISNLTIKNAEYAGLFGYTEGATITNVHLESLYIDATAVSGKCCVGTIIANMNGGKLSRSYVDNRSNIINIDSTDKAGGLVYTATNDAEIYECFTKIDLTTTATDDNRAVFVHTLKNSNIHDCYGRTSISNPGSNSYRYMFVGVEDSTYSNSYSLNYSTYACINPDNGAIEEVDLSDIHTYVKGDSWEYDNYSFETGLPMLRGVAQNWINAEVSEVGYGLEVGGDGSIKTIYTIGSENDLAWLMQSVNNGSLVTSGSTIFVLTANIDLNGRYWTPIGTTEHPFKGEFRFGVHKIENMIISTNSIRYVGLFGYTDGANINAGLLRYNSVDSDRYEFGTGENKTYIKIIDEKVAPVGADSTSEEYDSFVGKSVAVDSHAKIIRIWYTSDVKDNPNLSGYIEVDNDTVNYVTAGALVGQAFDTDIAGVCVNVPINIVSSATVYMGGLVGSAYTSNKIFTIDYCFVTGKGISSVNSSGYMYAGGIVGYAAGSYSSKDGIRGNPSNIKNSVSAIDITVDNHVDTNSITFIGGIVGYAFDNMFIDTCFAMNFDSISNSNSATDNPKISTVSNRRQVVGEIVGYLNSSSIEKCFSKTDINITTDSSFGYVGGIAGGVTKSKFGAKDSIMYCYSFNLNGDLDLDSIVVGGVVGIIEEQTVDEKTELDDGTAANKYISYYPEKYKIGTNDYSTVSCGYYDSSLYINIGQSFNKGDYTLAIDNSNLLFGS